jgi:hypothetical protein
MSIRFRISADDIRVECLMSRRNYYREHVIAPLERRLDRLKELSFHSWTWLAEERCRVETEIAESQKMIGEIEGEISSMGRDADVLESIDMDANSRSAD